MKYNFFDINLFVNLLVRNYSKLYYYVFYFVYIGCYILNMCIVIVFGYLLILKFYKYGVEE